MPDDECALTRQQRDILTFLARGLSEQECAGRLRTNPFVVGQHLQAVRQRLGARTTVHAVVIALRRRLIQVD